jgi:protein O-mannosyl-transferase
MTFVSFPPTTLFDYNVVCFGKIIEIFLYNLNTKFTMAKQKPQSKQPKSGGNPQAVSRQTSTQTSGNQSSSIPLYNFDDNKNISQWVPAILAALIFVSYIPVWQNEFVWDDKPYIMVNDLVKNFNLKGIFTEFVVGNYHPLTVLSYAIEYALVKEQTWLYHLDNLMLHTINSWLVFKLLQKLNGNFLTSIFTAVLFAVHPLHVESVAWVAERKDVLYTLFLFLSLRFYLKFDEKQDKKFYVFSILLFVASCMSKGMAVVLPAILIITDYCFLKKPLNFKLILNKIPYFVITLVFAYLATHAQKDAGADASTVIGNAYTGGERILMVAYSFCFYWVKTIIPFKLFPFYPYPGRTTGGLPAIYSLAFLGMIILAGTLYWFGRKDKRIWWAGAFFLIAISTVLQILPVGSALVADRYYYLSSVGPLFLLSLIINKFCQKSKVTLPIFGIIVLGLCGLSFKQTGTWKNGLTLFTDADKEFPDDAMILSNLGWYYLETKEFPTSKRYLMRADDGGFKNGDVCRTIGSMFLDEGDSKSAIKYFERATQYLPKTNRTNWLFATAYYKMNDMQSSERYYRETINNEPKNAEYWNSFGLALTGTGKYEESRKAFKEAIKLQPDLWDAYLNHAFTYRKEIKFEQEIKELDALITKNPDYLTAYRNIGVTYIDLKQDQKAVEYWKRAAEREKTGEYEYNIGINYVARGDIKTATEWYIKAAREGNINAKSILEKNEVKY